MFSYRLIESTAHSTHVCSRLPVSWAAEHAIFQARPTKMSLREHAIFQTRPTKMSLRLLGLNAPGTRDRWWIHVRLPRPPPGSFWRVRQKDSNRNAVCFWRLIQIIIFRFVFGNVLNYRRRNKNSLVCFFVFSGWIIYPWFLGASPNKSLHVLVKPCQFLSTMSFTCEFAAVHLKKGAMYSQTVSNGNLFQW